MYHNIAAGRIVALFGSLDLRGVGVGNSQRKMEFAVRIMADNIICPFGSFVVAGFDFGADGIAAQRYVISFDDIWNRQIEA